MRRGAWKLIPGVAIVLAIACPGTASAAQTIGQTGSVSPPNLINCADDKAYVQKSLAAGTAYSPSSYGVITSWAAAADAGANGPLTLMVVRPDGGNLYTALLKDTRTLTIPSTLNTFTGMRLPIESSQEIGVYLPLGSGAPCEFGPEDAGDNVAWTPPGEPPLNTSVNYSGADTTAQVNVRAVVEPDTDRDVFGDETQDKCVGSAGSANGCPSTVAINKLKQAGDTKVKATVTVPGAGTLSVGSASDPALASKAAKTLQAVKRSLTSTSRQKITLKLKLTKSAIATLRDAGKLQLKVKAVYTPVGGPPGAQVKKKKLS